MCEVPKQAFDALLAILGGVIAGCVGIYVGIWQRRRDAKNQFLIAVSLVKGEMPRSRMFDDFHIRSLGEIRDSVFRVLPFLGKTESMELLSLWKEYYALTPVDLNDGNEDEVYRTHLATENKPVPDRPSDILKSYFDRMAKIVE